MNDNKVTIAEVIGIKIEISHDSNYYIKYSVEFNCQRKYNINEELLFSNKEELIKSL